MFKKLTGKHLRPVLPIRCLYRPTVRCCKSNISSQSGIQGPPAGPSGSCMRPREKRTVVSAVFQEFMESIQPF